MRTLTTEEIDQVNGGGIIADSANTGGIIGTVVAVVAEGGSAAAVTGIGSAGIALGFSFGVGYVIGTWIYETACG